MKRSVRKEKRAEAAADTSLRFYLLRFLVIFLVVAIFVTWLFQVGLLNILYEKVRKKDMEKVADEIVQTIGTKRFTQTVYALSMDNLLNIQVYLIDRDRAIQIASESPDTEENDISIISMITHTFFNLESTCRV